MEENLRFWAKCANLVQIWGNFGQKGPLFNFPKKCEKGHFFRLHRLVLIQQARGARSLDRHYLFKD